MQRVVDFTFNELDLFLDRVRNWDLDFRQIHSGGLCGHLVQVVSNDILISNLRIKQGLHQMGSTPPGFRTFGIPGQDCHGFWWRGHQVSNHNLLVFPTSNELQSVSQGDFEVFTISLSLTYIERLCENLDINPMLENEVIQMDHRQVAELRRLAQASVISHDNPAHDHCENLAQALLICCTADSKVLSIQKRKRDLAISKIITHLTNDPIPFADMASFCQIAKVSERTLQYAFMERYGIAPNIFVKRWKLNSARRLLSQSNSSTHSVVEVCTRLGFQHPSQFTQDYKHLFAELPSQTLARKR